MAGHAQRPPQKEHSLPHGARLAILLTEQRSLDEQNYLEAGQLAAATQAFEKEAHLLAGLMHPNLPRILDHFTDHGKWYLVMDSIEGKRWLNIKHGREGNCL